MKGEQNEEILMVEDISDLLGHSLNSLIEKGSGNICISKESQKFFLNGSNESDNGETTGTSDLSYALIYTKSFHDKNKVRESIKINSKLRVIPLLLLSGPKKELGTLTSQLDGRCQCFKEQINLKDFIEKIEDMPIFWASINTPTESEWSKDNEISNSDGRRYDE